MSDKPIETAKLPKSEALKGRIEAAKRTRKENKQRRKGMAKKVISLKIVETKLATHQKVKLEKFFLEAKWITNAVIGSNDIFNFVLTPLIPVMMYNDASGKCDIPELRELTMGSQMRQSVVEQVQTDIVNLSKKKAKGGKVGARRFSKEQNCIPLKQYGVTYWQLANKNCFNIQKIGKVRVSGAGQIKDILPCIINSDFQPATNSEIVMQRSITTNLLRPNWCANRADII